MTRTLRIAVAEDEDDTRAFLQELLERLGHQVVAARTGRQLLDQCRLLGPDLVLTDVRMPDMDGLEAAALVNRDRPTPVIVISAHHDPEVLRRAQDDHIMAYLVKPVASPAVEAAITVAMARFEQFQLLRQEARDLRQALEDRKLIERAKGTIMRRAGVDEPEAFRRLQRLASDHNQKLVEAARTLLTADEALK